MFNSLIKEYFKICEKFFNELIIRGIVEDEDVLFGILENSLNKNNFKNKKHNSKEIIMNGCKAIIKSGARKGDECGKKPFILLGEEQEYCAVHIKNSNNNDGSGSGYSSSGLKKEYENSDLLIIKKNEFGNFVFGNSGLIIKSSLEKYVVAKQGNNGEWLSLTQEDITMCKKFHLRYKIIDLNFKGEKTNSKIIKNFDMFSMIKDEPKMKDVVNLYELNFEKDEN